MKSPQKLGLAYLPRRSSHSMTQPPVSPPDLPAGLATRVAGTTQHGSCHILHSSPSLLPVALSAHMSPSPREPSPDSLRQHTLTPAWLPLGSHGS